MTIKTTLLAAGSVLLLSAGVAAAAPATARSDLNVRSGPGTQYQVVGTIPGGETVDVGGCTGSWCQVSFSGGTGYASSNYLEMAGGVAPSVGVAVAPGYAYDEPAYVYDDDYYGYGYSYGPSFGLYFNPRIHRHHRHGWHGRPGWNRDRVGNGPGRNWQGRPGFSGNRIGNATPGIGGNRIGNASPGFNRGAMGGRPSVSAPVGMSRGPAMGGARSVGGGAGVFRGGAGAHIGGGGHRR